MKNKKNLLIVILSLASFNSFSQDTIFIYDIASQTLSYRLMPAYNMNAVSDSTNASFGVHGITNMPTTPPVNTYPSTQISLLQKASDYYSTFNFPFTAVSLIKYGFNITSAVIGPRALLVSNFDVRQAWSYWRNLSDASPFYENRSIQYGFTKLTPVKYYVLNSPDGSPTATAVVEVAENIGDYSGYFGLAFDTTANAYDSLLLYNISYPVKDMFNIYPDSLNGDTLYMKYGYVNKLTSNIFEAYKGGNGEYISPFFDGHFRLHGFRWSLQQNYFIGRTGFYFLKYVLDSLTTNVIESKEFSTWKIYPNPATNLLTITTTTNTPSEIIIYDIASRKLMKEKFTKEVSLNIGHLAKGIYLYQVTDERGMITRGKVVKE